MPPLSSQVSGQQLTSNTTADKNTIAISRPRPRAVTSSTSSGHISTILESPVEGRKVVNDTNSQFSSNTIITSSSTSTVVQNLNVALSSSVSQTTSSTFFSTSNQSTIIANTEHNFENWASFDGLSINATSNSVSSAAVLDKHSNTKMPVTQSLSLHEDLSNWDTALTDEKHAPLHTQPVKDPFSDLIGSLGFKSFNARNDALISTAIISSNSQCDVSASNTSSTISNATLDASSLSSQTAFIPSEKTYYNNDHLLTDKAYEESTNKALENDLEALSPACPAFPPPLSRAATVEATVPPPPPPRRPSSALSGLIKPLSSAALVKPPTPVSSINDVEHMPPPPPPRPRAMTPREVTDKPQDQLSFTVPTKPSVLLEATARLREKNLQNRSTPMTINSVDSNVDSVRSSSVMIPVIIGSSNVSQLNKLDSTNVNKVGVNTIVSDISANNVNLFNSSGHTTDIGITSVAVPLSASKTVEQFSKPSAISAAVDLVKISKVSQASEISRARPRPQTSLGCMTVQRDSPLSLDSVILGNTLSDSDSPLRPASAASSSVVESSSNYLHDEVLLEDPFVLADPFADLIDAYDPFETEQSASGNAFPAGFVYSCDWMKSSEPINTLASDFAKTIAPAFPNYCFNTQLQSNADCGDSNSSSNYCDNGNNSNNYLHPTKPNDLLSDGNCKALENDWTNFDVLQFQQSETQLTAPNFSGWHSFDNSLVSNLTLCRHTITIICI